MSKNQAYKTWSPGDLLTITKHRSGTLSKDAPPKEWVGKLVEYVGHSRSGRIEVRLPKTNIVNGSFTHFKLYRSSFWAYKDQVKLVYSV